MAQNFLNCKAPCLSAFDLLACDNGGVLPSTSSYPKVASVDLLLESETDFDVVLFTEIENFTVGHCEPPFLYPASYNAFAILL